MSLDLLRKGRGGEPSSDSVGHEGGTRTVSGKKRSQWKRTAAGEKRCKGNLSRVSRPTGLIYQLMARGSAPSNSFANPTRELLCGKLLPEREIAEWASFAFRSVFPPQMKSDVNKRKSSLILRKGRRVLSLEISSGGCLSLLSAAVGSPPEQNPPIRMLRELRAARTQKCSYEVID